MINSKILVEKTKNIVLFLLYPVFLFFVTYFLIYALVYVYSGVLGSDNAFVSILCFVFLPVVVISYFIMPLALTIFALKKWGNYLNKYFDNMIYPISMLVFVCLYIIIYEQLEYCNNFLIQEIWQNETVQRFINISQDSVLPHFIAIFIYSLGRIIIRKFSKINNINQKNN